MKIAIVGSAPSSLGFAPWGDPSWKCWGCSPGVYSYAARVDAWFELHRWEPGIVGKGATQKPWFSPEYVQWMKNLTTTVWMAEAVPDVPMSKTLPIDDLKAKYGTYFFTSSISIMIACAIEDILEARRTRTTEERDIIGLFGVDMAANEEYGYQRAGCQHFLTLAHGLDIDIYVPPESDLLRPMPIYGISELSWFHIKNTARRRELEQRLQMTQQQLEANKHSVAFLQGALDDLNYQMLTWGEDREGSGVDMSILAQSPKLREVVLQSAPAPVVIEPPPAPVVKPKPRTKRRK